MSEMLMGDKAMWFLHMKLLIISLKKCTISERQENNHIDFDTGKKLPEAN